MTNLDLLDKRHQQATQKLLEEAAPFLVGEPKIWIKRIAEDVTFGEHFAQHLKASIPFMKGKLRPDILVFHDLPTSKGLLHVVHTYSGNMLMPVDFLLRIDGRIPRSAVLNRGMMAVGHWESSIGNDQDSKDTFCKYLSELKRGRFDKFTYRALWDLEIGSSKINLPWTMQLVPLSDHNFLFIFHQPYERGLFGGYTFGIKKFVELADWLKESVHQFDYSGPSPKTELLAPTFSLLSISEIVGEQRGTVDQAVVR
jgi:hypothetical protein